MIVRALVLGILAAGIAGSVRGLARAARDLVPLKVLLGPWAWLLLLTAAAAIPLAVAAAARTVRRKREPWDLAPLRAAFVWSVVTAAVLLAAAQPIQVLWLELALGPATGHNGSMFAKRCYHTDPAFKHCGSI